MACVISAVISSDEKVSNKERERAAEFFVREFGKDKASAEALLVSGRKMVDRFEEHLGAVKAALQDNPKEAARFMAFLNTCIVCDGVDDREYVLFERVKSELFP
jgi:uncharacterized tellurite resistance protein B-like protein